MRITLAEVTGLYSARKYYCVAVKATAPAKALYMIKIICLNSKREKKNALFPIRLH